MSKENSKFKNKKLYIIISIIAVFIISFIVYLIYSRNKFINDIKSHYGKKVEIIKNTKIYSKNKKVIGKVNKGYTFDIENKTIDDTELVVFLNSEIKPIVIKSAKDETLVQLILPIKTY